MIDKALVLLPGRCSRGPLVRLGGLTVLQRLLYTAQSAGIRKGVVFASVQDPEVERMVQEDPKNSSFVYFQLDEGGAAADVPELEECLQDDVAVLSAEWILDRVFLRHLLDRREPLGGPVILIAREPAGEQNERGKSLPPASLLPAASAASLRQALLSERPEEAIADLLHSLSEPECIEAGEPAVIPIREGSQQDLERAQKALFRSLIKPGESYLSKNLERKISLSLTSRLVDTAVTPNQVSIVSICLGLVSGWLFLGPHRLSHVAGALLLWFSSVIDGCDGEIARLKFQESRIGSVLDFLGDNLVHIVVFFCIGFGLYTRGKGSTYLVLGLLAALGTLATASAVFWRVFLKSGSEGVITFATPVRIEEAGLAGKGLRRKIELADKISNRDFIYLILALSLVDGLWIYAWLSAIGTFFYLAYLLHLYRSMELVSRASPASSS